MSEGMLGLLSLSETRGPRNDLEEKLAGPDGRMWLQALNRFLRKENPWLTSTFTRDMAKEGWTLLEDVTGDLLPIDKLEPISFLNDGESYIGGEEMAKRAVGLHSNLGQRQAEYILERQSEIPEEFRPYILVFPGTVWRNRVGRRRVPYLYWYGERWVLRFAWLGHGWFSRCRLLRPRE